VGVGRRAPLAAGLLLCWHKGGPGAASGRLQPPSYVACDRLPPFHHGSPPVPTIEAGSNSHKNKCYNEEGDHHTKGQEGDHLIYEIKFNCIPSSRTAKAVFACHGG
jgi:hypothetical protein